MAFFEPLDIPEVPVASTTPAPWLERQEWFGPPKNVAPGVVALNLLLVHNERLAVRLPHAEAYRTGIVLRVELRGRSPARPGVEAGPGMWRFGVQLSDGQKLTTAGHGRNVPKPYPGEGSSGPLLLSLGGVGGPWLFRQGYWLWPLPPPGDLLIACEWPNVALPLTTATIDARRLREAADQARELWPEPDPLKPWEEEGPGQPMPPSSGMSTDAVKLVLSNARPAPPPVVAKQGEAVEVVNLFYARRMGFPTAQPANAVREISRHRSDDGNAATVVYRIVGTGTITFSATTEEATGAAMPAMRGRVVVTPQSAGS